MNCTVLIDGFAADSVPFAPVSFSDFHLMPPVITGDGSSVTLEVGDGKLQTNGLASVFFVDYDRTRERTRRARVIVIGE